jgi:hypothetical protein
MTRIAVILSIILSFGLAAYAWGDNPMIGKWNCTSADEKGMKLSWTLVVKPDGDHLSATLSGGDGNELPLIDPKLEGDTFTFKISINPEETVSVTVKVDGKKFAGGFSGKASGKGSFEGAKEG